MAKRGWFSSFSREGAARRYPAATALKLALLRDLAPGFCTLTV